MTESVSAGGIILNPAGQVAIVSQKGKYWSLPKGHVNPGEDILDAAIREIKEETGLQTFTLIKKLGNYKRLGNHNPNELKTIHIFLFTTVEQTLSPIDPDNPEAKWVSVDEVIHVLTSEIDKEFFQNQLQEIKSVFTP